MLTENDVREMFSNFRCPKCQSNFDENSIRIVRSENDGLIVLQFFCQNCQNGFGMALLGLTEEDIKKMHGNNTPAITIDDVIDAHKYIKNLDKNWAEFIAHKKIKE